MSSKRKSFNPGIVREIYFFSPSGRIFPLIRVNAAGEFTEPCPHCGRKHTHGVPEVTRPYGKTAHCNPDEAHNAIYTDPKSGAVTVFPAGESYFIQLAEVKS